MALGVALSGPIGHLGLHDVPADDVAEVRDPYRRSVTNILVLYQFHFRSSYLSISRAPKTVSFGVKKFVSLKTAPVGLMAITGQSECANASLSFLMQ